MALDEELTMEKMLAFGKERDLMHEQPSVAAVVRVKRESITAKLPKYGSSGAAGLDLAADLYDGDHEVMITIPAGDRKLVPTNLSIELPPGHYGRIAPRSGLAYKNGIDVMAGVIDEDYRGKLGVILVNLGHAPFHIRHGDRVAQLIIEKYAPSLVLEVFSHGETERGEDGFGSTGSK